MTIVDSTFSSPINSGEPHTTYLIDCHRCGTQFDSGRAAWCRCLVKERSFVCPHCNECFCRAVSDFKLKFWTSAPPFLWERKLKSARTPAEAMQNPAPDQVRRPLAMVVDDDREICVIASRLISETRLGVIVATNGEEAIRLAREYKPDVVLTDALMPKIDGREVCRTIKSDEALVGTKVVIMSSVYTSSRFRREALTQFKADDFLIKPVSPATLREALERAVADKIPPPLVVAEPPGEIAPPADPMLAIAAESPRHAVIADPIVPISEAIVEEASAAPTAQPRIAVNVDDLIRLHLAGVDGDLVRETRSCGYLFSIEELVQLSRTGVTPELFRRLNAASNTPLSIDDLRVLAQASALSSSEHAARLLILGFTPFDVACLVNSGVDAAMIEELHSLDCTSFSVTELVRLKATGVTPAFIAGLRELGCAALSSRDLIMLAACGLQNESLHALRALGIRITSTADLVRLQMSGITERTLNEFAASLAH